MILPDANLLLYAYDRSSPFHERSRTWWDACLSGVETVGLAYPVLFAFIRIGTNARAFTSPMTLARATHVTQQWLDVPVTQVLRADEQHMARTLELLQAAASSGGNLVTDAQIASLALAYDAVVHTADHDFRRFPQLKTHFPLEGFKKG